MKQLRLSFFGFFAAVLLVLMSQVGAQTATYQGPLTGSTDWTNAANWTGGAWPNSVDAVAIYTNTSATNSWTNSTIVVGTITVTNLASGSAVIGNGTATNDILELAVSSGKPSIAVSTNSNVNLFIYSTVTGTNGFTKSGAGNLTFRFNTSDMLYSGDINLNAGTLTINQDGSLGNANNDIFVGGTSTLAISPGNNSGTVTLGAGRAITINSGTLSVQTTSNAIAGVIQGVISGAGALTLVGPSSAGSNSATANSYTLQGANSYAGQTTIQMGAKVTLGAGASISTNALSLSGGNGSYVQLDLGGNTQSVSSLATASSTATARTMVISNGALNVGSGGVFTLNGINGTTINLSGLTSFTFNGAAGNRNFTITPDTVSASATNTNSVYLANTGIASNNISAAAMIIGGAAGSSQGGDHQGQLHLGKVNFVSANSLTLGGFNGSGLVAFQNGVTNGSLTLRGSNGIGRIGTLTVGATSSGTRSGAGTLILTNGTIDILASNALMGRYAAAASTSVTNLVAITSGTFDATSLKLGELYLTNGPFTASPNITSTFQQNGGTTKVQTITMGDSLFVDNPTNGATVNSGSPNYYSTYNLSGGELAVAAITAGTNSNYSLSSRRILNFNGGTLRNFDTNTDATVNGIANDTGGRIYLTAGTGNGNIWVDQDRTMTLGSLVTLGSVGTNTPSSGAITKKGPGKLDFQGAFGSNLVVKVEDGLLKLAAAPTTITISVTGSNGAVEIPDDGSGIGLLRLASLDGFSVTTNNIRATIGVLSNEFGIPAASSDFVLTLSNASTIDLRGLSNGLTYASSTAKKFVIESLGQTNSVYLPANCYIQSGEIRMGLTGTGTSLAKTTRVYLEGTNTWYAITNNIGGYRGSGEVYLTNNAKLIVAGHNSSNPTARLIVGQKISGSETLNDGTFNATNGEVDIRADSISVGIGQVGTGGNGVNGQFLVKQGNIVTARLGLAERFYSSINVIAQSNAVSGTLAASFDQSGGVVMVSSNLVFGDIIDLNAASPGSVSASDYPGHTNLVYQPTYHLRGGVLKVAQISASTVVFSTNSSRVLNLAGGTLQNLDSSTSASLSGYDTTGAGCLKLNLTSGTTNTINVDGGQAITLASTVKITGEGDLTKTGAGDLVVQGANTYPTGSNNIVLGGGALKLGFTGTNTNQTYLTVVADSTLDVGSWAEMHFRGADVSGAGKLTVKGTAKIYFGSNSTTLSSNSLANIQSFTNPTAPASLSPDGQLLFGASVNPPVFTSTNSFTGTVGTAFSAQVTATGDAPINFSATNLPAGLSINSAGQISGTPSAAGTIFSTLTATNGGGSVDQVVSFDIAKATPVLSGITASPINQGQALSDSSVSGTAKVNETNIPGSWAFTGGQSLTGSGTYNVVFTPTDTSNYNLAYGSASLTVIPASGISSWLQGQEITTANVGRYLVGGATNVNDSSAQPAVISNATHLVLSAIVRTNDSKGSVVGQWVTNVSGFSSLSAGINEVVGTPAAVQGTVPEGCERQEFSVPKSNGTNRLFLRLKATLQP